MAEKKKGYVEMCENLNYSEEDWSATGLEGRGERLLLPFFCLSKNHGQYLPILTLNVGFISKSNQW